MYGGVKLTIMNVICNAKYIIQLNGYDVAF